MGGSKRAKNMAQQESLQRLLRQIRLDVGLRQVDLANRLGRPQSFVSKYESGEKRLDILELRQICEAVGIPLVEFVRRLEDSLS
jgi:transcriptional regulator with XRE-family HTH domain